MWTLHKISSRILRKPQLTQAFLTVCPALLWQNLTSQPQKFSTEGHRAVIFHRKQKQFAKIDAKLLTVGMYLDAGIDHKYNYK